MNILGYDFLSDANCFLQNKDSEKSVESVTISNGTFDIIKLTKNISEYNTGSEINLWDDYTVFISDFEDRDLTGGNLSYFIEDIDFIKLKRRELGTFNWTGLYEYKITNPKNAIFTYIDKYARGRNATYEYCVAPIFRDGSERNYNIVEISSNFDGAVICDKDTIYKIDEEPTINTVVRNKAASIVSTMNNKYPFVFYGSLANYCSGSFSGVILKKGKDKYNLEESINYRDEIVNWLTNGQPKILKMFDGRMWMINVNGNVQLDYSQHYDKVVVSFDFVEVGSISSTEDMYNNNFTDYV